MPLSCSGAVAHARQSGNTYSGHKKALTRITEEKPKGGNRPDIRWHMFINKEADASCRSIADKHYNETCIIRIPGG